MPDGIQQLGAQLAEALAPRRSDLVTVSYGTVKAVNETGTDVRLDVDLHGGTLYGLPMTTACKGVAVGDRVIVQTYGHLSTVTGVIAHDNSHYIKKLWTGSWQGGSVTVPGISKYTVLIVTAGSINALGVKSFLVTKRIGYDSNEITYMGTNTQIEGGKTIHIEAFSATSTVGEPDVLRGFGTNNTPFRSYGVGPSGDSNGVGFAASEPVIGIYGLL